MRDRHFERTNSDAASSTKKIKTHLSDSILGDGTAPETIAQAIVAISKKMEEISSGPLELRTIVVLIHHETKIPMRDIQVVLKSLRDLKKIYCK